MAFTLSNLHVSAHTKVGTITFGLSSASTDVNSFEDQTASSAHADDQFNAGTAYFIRSPSDDSTASWFEGRFARILDYDASSGEYVLSTVGFTTVSTGATTGLIPSETEYGVATPEFNTQLMNQLANIAVRTLSPLVYTDRSIQTSASQTVYSLTTAMGRSKPFKVEIMSRTGSSADDPDWYELHGWDIHMSTVGEGRRLVFPRSLPQGRDLLVHFEADHPTLTASTQIIDGRLHPELVTLALVEKMYEYRNSRARGAQEFDIQRWNDAKRQLAEARIRWPVDRLVKRKTETLRIGRTAPTKGISAPPYNYLD